MIMQDRVSRYQTLFDLDNEVIAEIERDRARNERCLNTAKTMEAIVAKDLEALMRAGAVTDYKEEGE